MRERNVCYCLKFKPKDKYSDHHILMTHLTTLSTFLGGIYVTFGGFPVFIDYIFSGGGVSAVPVQSAFAVVSATAFPSPLAVNGGS